MPRSLPPREVYDLAVAAGLDHGSALIATAVAWGESGLNPDAVGDLSLQDDVWGPSLGLWQVRSLKAHRGTGRARDADRLLDPEFNAAAMAEISSNGSSFSAWTIFRIGAYQDHLEAVRQAVEGDVMAEVWHPRARRVEPVNTSASSYRVDCPYKFVLHTTEGGRSQGGRQSYHGHQSYPHFEVHEDGIDQFFPVDVAAKALYNASGGVETNAARAIQVEIAWRAGAISDLPDPTMANLADLTGWLVEQGYVKAEFVDFPANYASVWKFSNQEWLEFNGICGHAHVPENADRWDPGPFPVERLQALLGTTSQEDELTEDQSNTLRYIADVVTEFKNFFGRFAPKGDGDYWAGQDELERLIRGKDK